MRKDYYIKPEELPNKTFSYKKAFKYAKLMEKGEEFPPVKVYINREKGHLTFNDGRHRVAAAKMSGKPLLIRRKINA